jgi:hypothetical protein
MKGSGSTYYSSRVGYPFILGFSDTTVTLSALREAIWKRASRFAPTISEFTSEIFNISLHRSVEQDSGVPLTEDTITFQEQPGVLYATWNRDWYSKFEESKTKVY